MNEALQFVFGLTPDPADVERWHSQALVFSDDLRFSLLQSVGGPCGVLAPLQALILKYLLFTTSHTLQDLMDVSDESRIEALIEALLLTLLRAAENDVRKIKLIVIKSDEDCEEISVNNLDEFKSTVITRFSELILSPFAALQVVVSLVFTKTVNAIKAEMDDPCSPLISRFGHCSQELVNLMLTGVASSNVFDGCQSFDHGFEIRGISTESPVPVGYLTELEALNYVFVGDILKYPSFPLWILGSASHYTLLFGLDLACARVSENHYIKAAFHKFRLDEGIALEQALPDIIRELHLSQQDAAACRRETSREGVVLYSDFENWVRQKLGTVSQPTQDIQLYLLNGQDPPQLSQLEIVFDGKSESCDEQLLYATLQSRWPNSSVRLNKLH